MFWETNHALVEIVGDLAPGHSLYELLHPDDVPPLRTAYQELVDGRSTGFRLPQRIRLIGKDGEPAWTYIALSLLRNVDGEPTGQVTIVEDVTELHCSGNSCATNRCMTRSPVCRISNSLDPPCKASLNVPTKGSRITVCKLDMDGLAVINDGFGRKIGDQVLHQFRTGRAGVHRGQRAGGVQLRRRRGAPSRYSGSAESQTLST